MALQKPFSIFLVILLTFLLYATLTDQKIVRDLANGIRYAYFVKHDKKRLNTEQLLASLTAQSSSECGEKCLLNKACFSVNYGGIEGLECQLLAANKFDCHEELKIDEHFQHFSVASPCDKGPCQDGKKCLPLYEQNSYLCDEGRILPSPDGNNWTAFWWYDINTTWPSDENDVLAYCFGHCRSTDPYCFGRLPSDAIEASTEMLAIDSEGTEYKWSFDPGNSVAHAAWRAFHDHEIIPAGEILREDPDWNPEVLKGDTPKRPQDSFMYREQNGVMSVMLDNDNCDCYSSLSLGHGMCYEGHKANKSPENQFGVDTLLETCGNVVMSGPRSSVGLTLYFRTKP